MSKKALGPKALIYPQPVLICGTYAEDGTPDAMNIAYGGVVNGNRVQINIGVRHKTSDNIKVKQCFTIGIADVKNELQADYVGVVSGKDTADKVAKTGWTVTKSEYVDAPVFEELPITLHCKVEEINQYNQTLRIVAEVVETTADESVLDAEGKIDTAKLEAISFDPGNMKYLKVSEVVGNAFADGKKL